VIGRGYARAPHQPCDDALVPASSPLFEIGDDVVLHHLAPTRPGQRGVVEHRWQPTESHIPPTTEWQYLVKVADGPTLHVAEDLLEDLHAAAGRAAADFLRKICAGVGYERLSQHVGEERLSETTDIGGGPHWTASFVGRWTDDDKQTLHVTVTLISGPSYLPLRSKYEATGFLHSDGTLDT